MIFSRFFGKKPDSTDTAVDDKYAQLEPAVRNEIGQFKAWAVSGWTAAVRHPSFNRTTFEFQVKAFVEKAEKEGMTRFPIVAAYARQKLLNLNELLFEAMEKASPQLKSKVLQGFETLGRKLD